MNVFEEAAYWTAATDGSGQSLTGRHEYLMRFPPGTTGTAAGDYLLSGPGWKGTVPEGVTQIRSPSHAVLVIGRVFVGSESDLPIAYGLAKQMQLVPLGADA